MGILVLTNDTDPDGDPLSVSAHTDPAIGTVSCDNVCTYTPNPGFTGTDSFTHTASDGTDTATVTVTGGPVNQMPSAVDDNYTTPFGSASTVSAPGVLANDTDPDGNALTVGVTTQPAHGTLGLAADGSFTYVPEPGFTGEDQFGYAAADADGASDEATVTITVLALPDAHDDSYSTSQDTPLAVAPPGVLTNDEPAGDETLGAIPEVLPTHGGLDLAADGSFTYTPDPGFTGEDQFGYVASGPLGSSAAKVTITVTAASGTGTGGPAPAAAR